MGSNYTGDPTATEPPDSAPAIGNYPIVVVPADGDAGAAATFAQGYKDLANWVALLSQNAYAQNFGGGSDGAYHLSGSVTLTLTRDMYYTSLLCSGNIYTNGFAIYCTVSATFASGGQLLGTGDDASGSTGGNVAGPHGCPGASGAATTAANTPVIRLCGLGASGVAGGIGASASFVAGKGVPVQYASTTYMLPPYRYGQVPQSSLAGYPTTPTVTLDYIRGGGAGGAGGGDGSNPGGGGGAGGSLVVLISPVITISASATPASIGGNGGTPGAGNCGGGSGGSGGAFLYVCRTIVNSAIHYANPGAAGAHLGTGTTGSIGNAGNTTPFVITI